MLYQMLAGDVPFKGSSIPAIMKKHISDPAPTLADAGLDVSPELERAVYHTLEKGATKRTASVEMFVEELRDAIQPAQFIHTTGGRSLPVSSLKITTRPPKSSVYVDNIAVGQTRDDGLLLLDGVQSGNHHLRVSHNGFQDWLGDVICDGKPQEVVAELREGMFDSGAAIPRPAVSIPGGGGIPITSQMRVIDPADEMAKTVQQSQQSSRFDVAVDTVPPKKKSGLSTVLFIIGGLFILGIIAVAGLGAAYMLGFFGGPRPIGNNAAAA